MEHNKHHTASARPLHDWLKCCAYGLTACLSLSAGTSANAENLTQGEIEHAQFLEDIGASNRIDAAGKLRMLSQRIPAAACNYVAGIETDASGAQLTAAIDEFRAIEDALEFGDESLGIIGAEERRKTLVGLRKLREASEPMLATAIQVRENGGTTAEVTAIAGASAEVLRIAVLLVSEISGQYSDPTALLQIDALTIDIAGRQRMLSQRISKDVCLMASGINSEAAAVDLAQTTQGYDNAKTALLNGMPDAGIRPPPSAEIAEALQIVVDDWKAIHPVVDRVIAGEPIDDETRSIIFSGANVMTADMDAVVHMYADTSKLDL